MYTHVHTLFRFIYFGKLVEVEARSGKKRASLKYRRDAGARVHACVRACVRSFVRSFVRSCAGSFALAIYFADRTNTVSPCLVLFMVMDRCRL